MRIVIMALAAAALAGCASTAPTNTGPSEYDKLDKECRDRGGILKPIPGANHADDRANYACEFRGATPPRAPNTGG